MASNKSPAAQTKRQLPTPLSTIQSYCLAMLCVSAAIGIMQKMGAGDRTHAITIAARRGIIQL
jgi:hypothetical protein